MCDEIRFPSNPFEDIKPSDFNKLNKKNVTEDFVEENLKELAWDVFIPFNDTGIDRIAIKTVCPDGHTEIDGNLRNQKCSKCGKSGIEIIRFIQIKTRQLKNNVFGFTLKSKDVRIDPRHIYFLYSDNTTKDKQDFIIISVKDFLSFFNSKNINPFAPTSFRKGNNKLNSLKYDPVNDRWSWGSYDWELFRNLEGMKKIQYPKIDLNLANEIMETRHLANKLLRSFSKGQTYSESMETKIKSELERNLSLLKNRAIILELRRKAQEYIESNCDDDTLQSSRNYFEYIKLIDTIGENSDSVSEGDAQ